MPRTNDKPIWRMLMKNFLAALIALAVAAYFGSLMFGPIDELSTFQWIVFMVIGSVVVIGIMLLLGSSTPSESLHEECTPEDYQAT